MATHWSEVPIHVIDFEGSRASGVVEYGVVTLLDGGVSEVRTRICAPKGGHIPEAETRVHGIGRAQTAGAAPFELERELFMNLRSSGPLCAHNAAFEKHLIKSVWPYPRSSPDFLNAGRDVADWGPWVDTLRLYEQIYPQMPEFGLGALLKRFGLTAELDALAAAHCPPERSRYHCALYDALGSALLLLRLGRLEEFESMNTQWLVEHSQPAAAQAGQQELF